jgi:hypothetical protein
VLARAAPGRRAAGLALAVLLGFAPASVAAAETPRAIVFCAPGFPGTTAQAAATMQAFARAAAKAAGLPETAVEAEYHESEASGVERLRQDDAVVALVTLPFYAKHRDDLGLTPRLAALGAAGVKETYGLVARRGALASAAALAGYEIAGVPAFAPDFVRAVILPELGEPPASASIRFTSRVSSALVRAAEGEKVAVIVDGEQLAALPKHPRAAELEVVARSQPLPGSVVCEVAARGGAAKPLLEALDRLRRSQDGAAALESIRLTGFAGLDAKQLDRDLRLPPRGSAAQKP